MSLLDAGGRNFGPARPISPLPMIQGGLCTTEWNDIVFIDESRFFLQHHDGRIRVWRQLDERLLNYYVMHRHIGLASGIMTPVPSDEDLIPRTSVAAGRIHGITGIFQTVRVAAIAEWSGLALSLVRA
ncbi:hypothetical protein TNCV_4938251 [Trichonephila clavipes]|nr:hypothetical protein TNCV_4938251 [Trichonephila clavipes]